MSIVDFKKAFSGGGARANQFRVGITIPDVVYSKKTNDALKKIQFLCVATHFPQSSINVSQIAYHGRTVNLPGERNFQPWSITILNDTDFALYREFESWMAAINNKRTGGGRTNPLLFTADVSVVQLDRNDKVLQKFNMVDAWPSSISQIDLFANRPEIESFTVSFEYAYFTVGGENEVTASFGDVSF
jgi:hypothetical protein